MPDDLTRPVLDYDPLPRSALRQLDAWGIAKKTLTLTAAAVCLVGGGVFLLNALNLNFPFGPDWSLVLIPGLPFLALCLFNLSLDIHIYRD